MELTNLKQPLNFREQVLFVLTVSAYCLFFAKNCVLYNHQFIEGIYEENKKLVIEKTELESIKNTNKENHEKSATNNLVVVPWEELSRAIVNPLHMQGVLLLDSQFVEAGEHNEKILTSNLNVSGDFNAIKNYLSYMESLSPPVNIKKFSLENSGLSGNVLHASLEGVSYEKP